MKATEVPLADWPPRERLLASRPLKRRGEVEVPRPLPSHVGLWLDRCLVEPDQAGTTSDRRDAETSSKDQPGRRDLYVVAVAALRAGTPARLNYEPLYQRWATATDEAKASPGFARRVVELESTSRLVLHPAADSTVTAGGILLHHVYGVPYLPGSALKGVARACAMRQFGDEVAKDLFGSTPSSGNDDAGAGLFDFFDALWVPRNPANLHGERTPNTWSPLALDIVNPHHTKYYSGKEPIPPDTKYYSGKEPIPPDGSEAPVPVAALTVAQGSRFRVVVEAWLGPGLVYKPWLDWAVDEVLVPALVNDGVGARTSAGYGRFRVISGAAVAAEANEPGRPGSSAQTRAPEEFTGTLSYRPNTGELEAILPGGAKALAIRTETRKLLEQLDSVRLKRLMKKKLLRGVRIRCGWDGNRRTIETILPTS